MQTHTHTHTLVHSQWYVIIRNTH